MHFPRQVIIVCVCAGIALFACQSREVINAEETAPGTYGYDVSFLKGHGPVIELKRGSALVALSPKYQGRVMTSTSGGSAGTSYGWINYDLVASGNFKAQFNPVGGEERFWLGPEGGQYSLYFSPGARFDISEWQVPAVIDTITYDVVSANDTTAVFVAAATLTNYSGTAFQLRIDRRVTLLGTEALQTGLDMQIPADVKTVAYRTDNGITNTGAHQWKKDTGLISIWLLGMFTPSDSTTVIIPFKGTAGARDKITTSYFGEIPPERLAIYDSVLTFRCDGRYRSKIGLPPSIAKPVAGSFDAARRVLTIVVFPVHETGNYVNSKWEIQQQPFSGDVVNSYNDGPLADGTQLGPFYELESSSQALELQPGETQAYAQITYHFEGDQQALNAIAKQILGVELDALSGNHN